MTIYTEGNTWAESDKAMSFTEQLAGYRITPEPGYDSRKNSEDSCSELLRLHVAKRYTYITRKN